MLIIMYGVKDHIVPHIFGKKTTTKMWMVLESLYQSKNENRKMVLQERMCSTKMTKGEGVVHYLTRCFQFSTSFQYWYMGNWGVSCNIGPNSIIGLLDFPQKCASKFQFLNVLEALNESLLLSSHRFSIKINGSMVVQLSYLNPKGIFNKETCHKRLTGLVKAWDCIRPQQCSYFTKVASFPSQGWN